MKKTSVLILIVLGLALSLPLHGTIAQANDSMEAKQDSSVTDTIRLRGCRVGTPNPHFLPVALRCCQAVDLPITVIVGSWWYWFLFKIKTLPKTTMPHWQSGAISSMSRATAKTVT